MTLILTGTAGWTAESIENAFEEAGPLSYAHEIDGERGRSITLVRRQDGDIYLRANRSSAIYIESTTLQSMAQALERPEAYRIPGTRWMISAPRDTAPYREFWDAGRDQRYLFSEEAVTELRNAMQAVATARTEHTPGAIDRHDSDARRALRLHTQDLASDAHWVAIRHDSHHLMVRHYGVGMTTRTYHYSHEATVALEATFRRAADGSLSREEIYHEVMVSGTARHGMAARMRLDVGNWRYLTQEQVEAAHEFFSGGREQALRGMLAPEPDCATLAPEDT